ncbi:hypothetical protein P7C70_g8057, partial [Phenoliferia sp. Uapishka_3]
MTSIHDLPTETIAQILSLIHTPSSFEQPHLPRCKGDDTPHIKFNESLRDLQHATRVSKLWLDLGQPMLWRHLNIWSYNGARLVNNCPALGRFRTEELNILIGEDAEWDQRDWRKDFPPLIKGVKGLKKLVMVGNRSINGDWVTEESLKDLKTLNLNVIIHPLHSTPPANFQLSTLEIGGYVSDPSFITSVFTSSSHTLTSLKIDPIRIHHPTLLKAFPLIQNSLQHLDIVGELKGIDKVLPNLKVLASARFSFSIDSDNFFHFLTTALGALPDCTKTVALSLQDPLPEMMTDILCVVRYSLRAVKDWERLTVVECGCCGDDGRRGQKSVSDLEGWGDLLVVCEEKGVSVTIDEH